MPIWGLRKRFKFGVIRCITEELGPISRKTQSVNFTINFRGPWRKKLWVRSKKVRRCKMGRTSSVRLQSLVEIGGHAAT